MQVPKRYRFQKFYCYKCKTEVNHIEVKNALQYEEFKDNFSKGVYVNEAQVSISTVRAQWRG